MIKIIIFPLVPIIFILNLFLHTTFLDYITMLLAVLAILLSFSKTQSLYKWSSAFFLGIGIFIFFTYDIAPQQLTTAFSPMMGLLGLFFALPFLQAVVKLGKYDKSLNRLIKHRIQTIDGIYRRTSLCTYLLAIFLTIATLPIGVQSFHQLIPSLKGQVKQIFFTHSMLRAYSMALFWSPVELLVVASIDQLHADYLKILPILFITSSIYLMVDWLLQRKKYHLPFEQSTAFEQTKVSKKDKKKIIQLFGGILLLLVAVVITDQFIQKGLLISIVLVIFPFSFIWIILMGKMKIYYLYLKRYLPSNITQTQGFHTLFLSAGFFITMIQYSSAFEWMSSFFITQFNQLPIFLFLLLLMLSFWILSFAGLHGVVTITLFAQILQPISSGLENTLALVFIGSTVSLLMVSPFNLATSMMSHLIKTNPLKILVWNIKYAFCFSLLVVFISYSLLQLSK